jgi:hypothetical protein
MDYEVPEEGVAVSGPYRNGTVEGDPTLAVGERLTVDVLVENVGGRSGVYNATLGVNDRQVNATTGRLTAGERRTVTFGYTFAEPGTYRVAAGGDEWNVTVHEPARPIVDAIDVPSQVAVGEEFTVTATVINERTWPAAGEVRFFLDGTGTASRQVTLPGRTRVTYTATASFSQPGEHRIDVGGRSVTVQVGDTVQTVRDDDPSPLPMPGMDVPGAVAALLALVGIGVRRSR